MTTDTVLLDKNAHEKLPPASMSKLMTINMLFEALRDGRIRLDEQFAVSSRAKAMGGSTMFLNETDRPTVEELIKGIVVLSGNDACVVVAEGLAGTEEDFAKKMNERAKTLGLNDSTFANSSGWPHPNQRMSMHDLGRIAERLIDEFPEYYGYFALTEYEHDGRSPDNRFNRNPLLHLGIGADGLKTGHTQESGYGLVGSAVQGGRRIVFAITGLTSERERAEEAERVVNWAFREFVQKTVAEKGTRIAEADVWLGEATRVGLVVGDDLDLLLPSLAQEKLKANVVYTGPIEAADRRGPDTRRIADRHSRHSDGDRPARCRTGRAEGRVQKPSAHRFRHSRQTGDGRDCRAAKLTGGMFITFEGIDGSGKSTQARMLADHLRASGRDVVLTREPGGSPGAEEIRRLVLEGDPDRWSAETEILLFTAARRDHLERIIEPALNAGKIVISDRFADSTRMYQGLSRGDLRGTVDRLHEMMIVREPDLTFLIDMEPETGLARAKGRNGTEERFRGFRRRVAGKDARGFSGTGRRVSRPLPGDRRQPPAEAVAVEVATIAESALA